MNWRKWWYEFWYYPAAFLAFLLFSLRVRGRARVPQRGALLIVGNHQCAIDPVLIGIAVRRRVLYLARKTLFRRWWTSWIMESLGAVRLDQETRGAEGLKAAVNLLRQGEGVVVFPEGARTPDGAIHEFKPGVALLVRRSGATVLPVGIAGAFEAWPIWRWLPRAFCPFFLPAGKGGIAIVIGEPMNPQRLLDQPPERMLAELREVITDLREQAERLRRR